MTRVIAGQAGGRRLAVPPGRDTRPTSDRAREGLFATIASLAGPLAGARVLDLYAGSGAVGLEALSRGAGQAERLDVLLDDLAGAGRGLDQEHVPGAEVVTDRVERVLARGPAGGRYDVAFADPPYARPDAEVSRMLACLTKRDWLAPGALMIIERATRSGPLTWPDGFEADRSRRYGEATFWYGLARPINIVGEPRKG